MNKQLFFLKIILLFLLTLMAAHCPKDSPEDFYTKDNSLCGNNNTDSGEQCDSGAIQTDACEADCTTPVCGDNILNTLAGEQCDDGNTTDNDNGCDTACQFNSACGNSIVENITEQCDDGNTADGDGCSATCLFEPGSSSLMNTNWQGTCVNSEKNTMSIDSQAITEATLTIYSTADCQTGTEDFIARMTGVLTDGATMTATDIDSFGSPTGGTRQAVELNLFTGAVYGTIPASSSYAGYLAFMGIAYPACVTTGGSWQTGVEHIVTQACWEALLGTAPPYPANVYTNYAIDSTVTPNIMYRGTQSGATDDGSSETNRHLGIAVDAPYTQGP